LRVLCWQYCQLSILSYTAPHPCTPPSQQARRLSYEAKQGYVIYWIPVHHGACKCPISKGPPMQACPPWGQPAQVIPIDPLHKVIIRNPDTQWITKPVHKCRLTSVGRKSSGLGKGHLSLHKIGGSSRTAWRRHNTLQPKLHHYS
ncbi:hypothetical protein FD755_000875, partial [Muntiacus reevesi]